MVSKRNGSYAIVHINSKFSQPRIIQQPNGDTRRVLRELGYWRDEEAVAHALEEAGDQAKAAAEVCRMLGTPKASSD